MSPGVAVSIRYDGAARAPVSRHHCRQRRGQRYPALSWLESSAPRATTLDFGAGGQCPSFFGIPARRRPPSAGSAPESWRCRVGACQCATERAAQRPRRCGSGLAGRRGHAAAAGTPGGAAGRERRHAEEPGRRMQTAREQVKQTTPGRGPRHAGPAPEASAGPRQR